MLYLYYPLSSKKFTFENIFASESISPPFFYEIRGFGIGYFNVLPKVNHNYAIVLFSDPPKFDVENGIKFVLQIDANYVNMDNLIFLQEGVFAYQKTIYLNRLNFQINFFSEKDKKVTLLKAETSLPTKNLDKYAENFNVIEENACLQYNLNDTFKVIEDKNHINYILQDKKYNQFKGLVYGIGGGVCDSKPKEEVFFRKMIREVVNSFAEFKSRTVNLKFSYSKNIYNRNENLKNDPYRDRLLNSLEYAEQAYFDLFTDHNFNEDVLYEILLENIKRFNSIVEVKQFIKHLHLEDEIFGTKRVQEIKKKYANQINFTNKNIQIELLKSQIRLFIDESMCSNSKVNLSELNNEIKLTLYEIEKSINVNSQNKNSKKTFSLTGLHYDFEKNEISVDDKFQNLDNDEVRDMVQIINIIFRFSEKNKDTFHKKEFILDIVKEVGMVFSKAGKETLLYQYLNNETDTYSFEKISNLVLKNFVAFIFNIESLEKLEKFIDSKNVEKEWIAYSFWGAFNGFANLSGDFTKSIFSKSGEFIQIYLDEYLAKHIDTLKDFNLQNNEVFHTTASWVSSIEIFYKKFVIGKYKMSLEDFVQIIAIKDKVDFYKESKTKFKMTKKDSEKLFESIRKDFDTPLLFN